MRQPLTEYRIVHRDGKPLTSEERNKILDGQTMHILSVEFKEATYGAVTGMQVTPERIVFTVTPVEHTCHSCGTPVPKFGMQCDECKESR